MPNLALARHAQHRSPTRVAVRPYRLGGGSLPPSAATLRPPSPSGKDTEPVEPDGPAARRAHDHRGGHRGDLVPRAGDGDRVLLAPAGAARVGVEAPAVDQDVEADVEPPGVVVDEEGEPDRAPEAQ